MGTHHFLNKELQKKVDKVQVNRSSPLAVDGFNILRIIWSAHGYGSRVFLASLIALTGLAKMLAQEMAKYIEAMCPDRGEEPYYWTFDGNQREMEKLGEKRSKKIEATMLSKALFHIFVSDRHDGTAIGTRILNGRFSYPPAFLDCVLATLKDMPKHVVLQANGEADFAIARFCNLNKKTVVVSSDSDYLAFTNCLGVIVPQVDRRSYYSKQAVLDDRGCSAMEQMVAVCFNGQDHVHGVKGYGIDKCIKAFQKCKKKLTTMEEHFDYLVQFIKKKSKKKENPLVMAEAADLCKEEGMRLIQMFIEGKEWHDSTANFDEASSKLAAEEALYLKFAKEVDENGILRRPMLKAKLVDGYRNPVVKKTRTHEEHLLNQRVGRIVEAKNAVSKKARSLQGNIVTVQSLLAHKFTKEELANDEDSDSDDSDDSDEEEEEEEDEDNEASDKVGDSIPKTKVELHRQMALNQMISRDFGSMHQILLPELALFKFPEYMSQAVKLIKVN